MCADLRRALTPCLFGDELAADYLLAHLVGRVHVRDECQAVGQMTLNLSGVPAEVVGWYGRELYGVLEELVPASRLVGMTLANLNEWQWVPK